MSALENSLKWIDMGHYNYQHYKLDEPIFKEGDPFKGIYYVIEGDVKLVRKSDNKRIMLFARTHDFIGLTSYYNNSGKYSFSAKPYDKACKLIHIPIDQFKELLETSADFKGKVIRGLCDRINHTEKCISNLVHNNTYTRLIRTLVQLGNKKRSRLKGPNEHKIDIECTLDELAVLIGTTEDYLKKILHQLQNDGMVKIRRNSLIISAFARLKSIESRLI